MKIMNLENFIISYEIRQIFNCYINANRLKDMKFQTKMLFEGMNVMKWGVSTLSLVPVQEVTIRILVNHRYTQSL